MKKVLLTFIGLILLTGCAHPVREIYEPCSITKEEKDLYAGKNPAAISAPTANIIHAKLQKAKDAHVDGCASVTFKIDSKGTPTNIKVLKEFPTGYDFGKTAVYAVKNTKFTPPTKANENYIVGNAWHFP